MQQVKMFDAMGKVFIVLVTCLGLLPSTGQAQRSDYSFEQLDSLQRAEPRPVAVFIYTGWCKYCAAMKNTTLRDPSVVELLNQAYYFISLDAEHREDIRLRDHTFSYKPSGHRQGMHELAEQLGTVDGAMAYPTLCILNADYEIIFQHNQFIGAVDLVKVLETLPSLNAHPPPGTGR